MSYDGWGRIIFAEVSFKLTQSIPANTPAIINFDVKLKNTAGKKATGFGFTGDTPYTLENPKIVAEFSKVKLEKTGEWFNQASNSVSGQIAFQTGESGLGETTFTIKFTFKTGRGGSSDTFYPWDIV